MKNAYVLQNMARTLARTAENIDLLVQNSNLTDREMPSLSPMYGDMALDELNHVQIITLELTKLLLSNTKPEVQEDEAEGSTFGPGELDDKLSSKEADTDE